MRNLSEVALYCKQTPGLMVHARCCLNQKGTILGLDLQNCSLKDPGPDFPQAHTAVIIDLQANPLKDDLANNFHGFTQLQTLILPTDVNCPGGINAWNTVTFYRDNQTCQGQRDICNSTGDIEICPENGSCVHDGPGLLQCICADGFHGYKCMRQGSFSMLMFFGILGSTTLSISILLWGTQRRKAKAS
ncbi:all-trans retinoic acid-induced differentiation factor isoform X3 [Saccopteryx bilineata]